MERPVSIWKVALISLITVAVIVGAAIMLLGDSAFAQQRNCVNLEKYLRDQHDAGHPVETVRGTSGALLAQTVARIARRVPPRPSVSVVLVEHSYGMVTIRHQEGQWACDPLMVSEPTWERLRLILARNQA